MVLTHNGGYQHNPPIPPKVDIEIVKQGTLVEFLAVLSYQLVKLPTGLHVWMLQSMPRLARSSKGTEFLRLLPQIDHQNIQQEACSDLMSYVNL